MDHEIEKLKQTYLKTEAPVELDFYGFEDVLDRINNDKKKNSFYIYRYVGMALIVLVMLSGVAGITFASKPNSTLYPLKVAAQNAIANVTHTTPKQVEDTIDNILTPKKVTPTIAPVIIQSAPTPTPAPTGTTKRKIEIREDEEKKVEEQSGEEKNENSGHEEVKGISVTKELEKRESTQPQEQNKRNSDEQKQEQNNNSSSHSSNNSSEHEKD